MLHDIDGKYHIHDLILMAISGRYLGETVGERLGGIAGAHYGPWGALIGHHVGHQIFGEIGDRAEEFLKHPSGSEDDHGDHSGSGERHSDSSSESKCV